MSGDRPIGSLQDLLPRRGSVEYNALPKFVRDEIDLIHKGGRPVVPGDLHEVLTLVTALPDRIAALGTDQRVLGAEIRDALKKQAEATAALAKSVSELQKEQTASRVWLIDHEKRLDAHDVQHGVHAKKDVEHDRKLAEHSEHITGIHKRLVVVEERIVTKRRPKKLPRRKGK